MVVEKTHIRCIYQRKDTNFKANHNWQISQ